MRAMYENVWGWKPLQKQKELKDPSARFLIAYEQSGNGNEPVAYLHLRCAYAFAFTHAHVLSLVHKFARMLATCVGQQSLHSL